jgi:hypothetical protein
MSVNIDRLKFGASCVRRFGLGVNRPGDGMMEEWHLATSAAELGLSMQNH